MVSLLLVPLPMAQVKPPEENTAIMSVRQQRGLRGPVKSCTQKSTHPGMTGADGKTYPEVQSEYTTEYDVDGRILATRSRNSDGSQWLRIYTYGASGQLLKVTSGVEGKEEQSPRPPTPTISRGDSRTLAMMLDVTATLFSITTSAEEKLR